MVAGVGFIPDDSAEPPFAIRIQVQDAERLAMGQLRGRASADAKK
jgi:hypothetical protein